MKINQSNYENRREDGYKPVPRGTYNLEIIECDVDAVSKNGNGMIKLVMEIMGHGRKKVYAYVLHKYKDRLKDLCMAVGIMNKYNEGEIKNTDLIGKTLKADLIIEDKYNRIDKLLPKEEDSQSSNEASDPDVPF